MECVPGQGRAYAFRVLPGNVVATLSRAVICYAVIVQGRGFAVVASGKFIPWVVGQAVAVHVVAHAHNARFGAASFFVGLSEFVKAVAPYTQIHLAGYVHHGMVESECNIAAISAQAYHHVVGTVYALCAFLEYVGVAIALFVSRHLVDELARGRPVLHHFAYVRAVLHLFVQHMNCKVERVGSVGVDNLEFKPVGAFFGA